MLSRLTEPPAPPIEFDEKFWHAVVDKVTVMSDDRLVFSLKDGTEITIELCERIEKSQGLHYACLGTNVYYLAELNHQMW